MKNYKIWIFGGISIGMLVIASTASAATAVNVGEQNLQVGENGADDAPPVVNSGEIIVTAQKRSQTVSRTAIAITAIGGVALQRAGIVSVKDLTSAVPNVQIHTIGVDGFIGIAIRGISNGSYTTSANPAISTYIDGVYVDLPVGFSAELFDIERLEVLRGPQGTLYGRNAIGGNINIVTADPKAVFGGSGDLSYGSYNDVLGHATVNLPVTGHLSIRASAFGHRSDGFFKTKGATSRNYGASDDWGARVTALWTPSSTFKWRLSVGGSDGKGTPAAAIPTGNNGIPLDGGSPYNQAVSPDPEPYNDLESRVIRSKMDWIAFKNITLSYIAGFQYIHHQYKWATADNILITTNPAYEQDLTYSAKSQSHELNLAYNSKIIKSVTGATVFDDHISDGGYRGIYRIIGLVARGEPNYGIKKFSYGFFNQTTISILPSLRVTGGVRYSHDKQSVAQIDNLYCGYSELSGLTLAEVNGLTQTSPGCGPYVVTPSGSETSSKVTWKAVAEADVSQGLLAYGSVSTGYKQGGVQPGVPAIFPSTFKPETVISYEAGLKLHSSSSVLGFRTDAFYMNYKDVQTFQYISVGTTSVTATTNAGAARIYGFEAEGEFNPTPMDHFSTFFTYTHARYQRFDNAIDSRTAAIIPSLRGNQLPNAPDFTFQAEYSHDFIITRGGRITPQAAFYWQSFSFTQPINDGQYRIRAYHKTDLTLSYTDAKDIWTITAFIYNLENNAIKTSDFSAPKSVYSDFGAPRTFGVRAAVKW